MIAVKMCGNYHNGYYCVVPLPHSTHTRPSKQVAPLHKGGPLQDSAFDLCPTVTKYYPKNATAG